jgi:TolA-binding protein
VYLQNPLPPTPPPMLPFDPNQLIPLIGVIGVMVVTGVVLYAFFKSDLARAIAERIRAGVRRRKAAIDDVQGEHIEELEQRITDMQGQIAEMAERLDFAERLLAQKRERSLPGA